MLAAAGSIAFSGKAIIVKLAYRHGVDAVTLIMYRMLFALPLFLALAWWATYRQGGGNQPPLTRDDWLGILGLGVTGYYLASFLDFWGLQYISASLERLILYLNPTLVLVLGWVIYKRRITRLQALAMAVSYGGVLVVFGHEAGLQGPDALLGAALVFGSAISYAVYLLYSGELVQRLGSLRLVGLATSVACVLCLAAVRVAAAHERGAGGARGDLALGAQRHAVHLCAGAHGDDGDRAHRLGSGGADRHGRPDVDHRHGRGDSR